MISAHAAILPGFVRVLEETTVLSPDRKGNRRFYTIRNILENPNVGLLMFLPSVEEVMRKRLNKKRP